MSKKTAWMWRDGDQVRGLSFDREASVLLWHTDIGCHCNQHSDLEQSVEAFKQGGPPAFVGPLPADVAAEVAESLSFPDPT